MNEEYDNMKVILIIIMCVVLILAILVLTLVYKRTHKKPFKNDVHFSGGVNIETGQISSDNNYFKGETDDWKKTVVANSNYIDTSLTGGSIINLSDNSIYKVVFSNGIIIGRENGENVYLVNDKRVSKRHCEFYVKKGKLFVNDLNSSNHTFLNDQMVVSPIECVSGDVLRVGNTRLKIIVQ